MSKRLWKVLGIEKTSLENESPQPKISRTRNANSLSIESIIKKIQKSSGESQIIDSSQYSSHYEIQKEKHPVKQEKRQLQNMKMIESKLEFQQTGKKSMDLKICIKIMKSVEKLREISQQIILDLHKEKMSYRKMYNQQLATYKNKVQHFELFFLSEIQILKKENFEYQQELKITKKMYDQLIIESQHRESLIKNKHRSINLELEEKKLELSSLQMDLMKKVNKIESLQKEIKKNEQKVIKNEQKMLIITEQKQKMLLDIQTLQENIQMLQRGMEQRENQLHIYYERKAKEQYQEKIFKLQKDMKQYVSHHNIDDLCRRQEILYSKEMKANQFMLQIYENSEQLIDRESILENKYNELILIQEELFYQMQRYKSMEKAPENSAARTRIKTSTMNQDQMGKYYPNLEKKMPRTFFLSPQYQKMKSHESLVRFPYEQRNKRLNFQQFQRASQRSCYSPPRYSPHLSPSQTPALGEKTKIRKLNFNTSNLKKQLNKDIMNKLESLRIQLQTEMKNNKSQ